MWRDSPPCDFHAPLAGVLGPTLRGDQVIQVREPRAQALLAATWVMEAWHGAQCPPDGVKRLVQQRPRRRHPRVVEPPRPTPPAWLGTPGAHARRGPPLRCGRRARQRGIIAGRVQTPVSPLADAPWRAEGGPGCVRPYGPAP